MGLLSAVSRSRCFSISSSSSLVEVGPQLRILTTMRHQFHFPVSSSHASRRIFMFSVLVNVSRKWRAWVQLDIELTVVEHRPAVCFENSNRNIFRLLSRMVFRRSISEGADENVSDGLGSTPARREGSAPMPGSVVRGFSVPAERLSGEGTPLLSNQNLFRPANVCQNPLRTGLPEPVGALGCPTCFLQSALLRRRETFEYVPNRFDAAAFH